jgi:hypothetical protein
MRVIAWVLTFVSALGFLSALIGFSSQIPYGDVLGMREWAIAFVACLVILVFTRRPRD